MYTSLARPGFARALVGLLCVTAGVVAQTAASKRPIETKDFDNWRNIQNQQLSRDGRYLAYAVFPQDGDGEVVWRNLQTGAETREPAGLRPPPPPPNPFAEPDVGPPAPPGVKIAFTADQRYLVFSTFAPKAEVDRAKREKKSAAAMPKGGLVIVDLSSGSVTRVPRVKSFQVPDKGTGVIAYLRESAEDRPNERPTAATPAATAPQAAAMPAATTPSAATTEESKPAPVSAVPSSGASARPTPRRREYGTGLVLRALPAGTERTFADVLDYSLAKDARTLVYAVSSRQEERNGVYAVAAAGAGEPVALLSGKGHYSKVVWDENQTQLVFVSDHADAAAKQPAFQIYHWDRKAAQAAELVSRQTPGIREGFLVSDKGSLAFSKDGRKLYVPMAPAPAPEKVAEQNKPEGDRARFDLWHWKDDYIQPMQKARAQMDRTRTYTAVYHLPEKRLVQLADRTMAEVTLSEDGHYALGGDDREYRAMIEYDERYADTYLVDTATGTRRLLAKKHLGRIAWSPDGRYALLFNGKDWSSIRVPDGATVNLTQSLGVNFATEEHDTPNTPGAYGLAGWTKDGKWVLLYDHYDVWQVSPDGKSARNLTDGVGRKEKLMFRAVKTDPEEKAIDPAKPLLLRAENAETFASGFYRERLDAQTPPEPLLTGEKSYQFVAKAKDADVMVINASTVSEFPDLLVTDSRCSNPRKVTAANPQQAEFRWPTVELVQYKNLDGVPLKGLLYKPEDFDPGKKYPLMVYLYEKLSQNRYLYPVPRPTNTINVAQYVSKGYLVLEPDIVYTIGYPGQSALKCVLGAVQRVVDQGYVDEKAIGIQGHSWGGYQIAYMVTQTNRFKAAAPGAVVANMISAYDGIRWGPGLPRQFQYERTQSRIGGSLWQVPMRFIENSPVFMADRVKTPVLMMHNDADDAVPWYQGIEYYLALRRLGKEVYLFNYNGEPHNLRQRANQKDYTQRMLEFFDHYLKGAPAPAWMERGIPFLEREPEALPTDEGGAQP